MKDIDFDSIGKKLKEIRISKGFTQEFVATSVKVNTSHISNIENGKVKISLTTLINVCNVLGTTVDYVLNNEYSNTPSAVDNAILLELQKCTPDTKERILKIVQILQ
ncbi:helix-turn-helix domain-containing protein [uncultured Eubacterium sp.]|uniref:helix-turn-helix domain-containing protein n=1 Tax=uncultured Eubacterium sp. TaxID=165185 RepID=UPI00265CB7D9|nr:helix-turn-helix transcriptional regulator [uncultured Eubacterium sp.]